MRAVDFTQSRIPLGMTRKQKIDNLRAAVFSDDRTVVEDACVRLFYWGGGFSKTAQRKCRQFLIDLLDQDNGMVRNFVALTFRNQGFNAAVSPLFKALFKPENFSNRSTLVHALRELNCSQHLGEVFAILFGAANDFVVQRSALKILNGQVFEFTQIDFATITANWNVLKDDWNRLNNVDEREGHNFAYDREYIQSYVDYYLAYLNKES